MRITITLGGRYSNIRADIPIPLAEPFWQWFGGKIGLLPNLPENREIIIQEVRKVKSEVREEYEEDIAAKLDKILAANKRSNTYGVKSG